MWDTSHSAPDFSLLEGESAPDCHIHVPGEGAPSCQVQGSLEGAADRTCTSLALSSLPVASGECGWGDLPLELLYIILDDLLTAPLPHALYLKPKARSWSSICRVCRHWAKAMLSTPIGVCVPAALSPAAVAWLCKLKLRGIEFSNPKRSSAELLALLSHPQLVGLSSASLTGCINAPYDGTWTPASFPHLRTCSLHRCGAALPTFDITLVKGLAVMEDLVLASGFSHVINWADLPPTTQQVVWTCPGRLPSSGRPLTGHLILTDWPSTIELDSLVLEADHTLQVDPVTLTGSVSRIAIHVPYLFFSTPTPPGPSDGAWPSAKASVAATVECIAQSLMRDSNLVDFNISCFSLFAGTSTAADMDSNALSTMLPDILEPLVTALLAAVQALPPSPNRPQLRISRGHEGLELSLTRLPLTKDDFTAVLLSWDRPGALEEDLPRLLLSATPVCSIAFVDFVRPIAARPAEGVHALLQQLSLTPVASRFVCPSTTAVTAEALAQRALLTSRCLIESSAHQLKEVTGLLLLTPPALDPDGVTAADDAVAAAPIVLRHTGCNCGFGARAHALGLEDGKDGREGPGGGDDGGDVFLGPPLPLGVFRPLLAPFAHLNRVSLVTLTELVEQDVLPVTVEMVDFTAGSARQRFSATVVSNLLDMHSLTLRGYHSLDLAKLPAPARTPHYWSSTTRGLTLNVWDIPCARVGPLGHPDHDVLPTPGCALNMSVCLARGGPITGGGVLPPDMPPPGGGRPLATTASVMFALDAVSRNGRLTTVSCQFAEDVNAPQGGHVPTVHLANWPVARRLDLDMLMLLVHLGFMRNGWHVQGRRLHEQGAMLVSLHKRKPDAADEDAAEGDEGEDGAQN